MIMLANRLTERLDESRKPGRESGEGDYWRYVAVALVVAL